MGKSILIAEQSEIIRKGLFYLAESSGIFSSIHEVSCGSQLQDFIKRYEPDALLVNPSMVNTQLLGDIKELSNGNMRIGAIVYALFDDELMEQFDEVLMVNDTRQKLQKKFSALLQEKSVPKKIRMPEESLSARELDVLKLLVKGMSNKEISEKLFISTHTVISHRKNITQKLSIKSVAGLTVYAILNELISMEEVQ